MKLDRSVERRLLFEEAWSVKVHELPGNRQIAFWPAENREGHFFITSLPTIVTWDDQRLGRCISFPGKAKIYQIQEKGTKPSGIGETVLGTIFRG